MTANITENEERQWGKMDFWRILTEYPHSYLNEINSAFWTEKWDNLPNKNQQTLSEHLPIHTSPQQTNVKTNDQVSCRSPKESSYNLKEGKGNIC